ncbi:MAG: cyclase [Geobacteraceae bacterium GWC2_58_44]|nr:MAG: cyclase [Geobacteraceae bacterium GWC2_58_44]HBG05349.1 cyclase [Geobacter sp.]
MRIHDITMPLSAELPVYPGDPPVLITPWSSISDGDTANLSQISLCTHSGTHLDAPRHFIDNGASVDELPLGLLIGKALVAELPGVKEIGRKELERLRIKGVERLLLKTDNSKLWKHEGFVSDFAALSVEGARYLQEAGVKLIGIDYLSVESMEGDGEVHRVLLDNGVLILEGVNLADVAPGEYELICLPLKIQGGDGAPVRALLRGGAEPGAEAAFDPHTTKWPLA